MSVKVRKKKIAGGKVSLYLDIYHKGNRKYEFLQLYLAKDRTANKETLAIAESIAAKKQLEISFDSHGFTPNFKKNADFIEYFEKYTRPKAKSSPVRNTLRHLKIFTGGKIKISQIDERWCEKFRDYLSASVSPNSVRTYLARLNVVLNQAVKDKIITKNPHQSVEKVKKVESERVYLTLEELNRITKAKFRKPEIKRAFLFACYTGLRFSDLKNLTWKQICLNGTRHKLEFRQKKTGSFEYFPLSITASKILTNGKGNLINMPDSKVFKIPGRNNYNEDLKLLAKAAGIDKNMTSHTGRHTFATLMLTQGVDIYTVSKLLGHKSLSTTQIYAKIIDQKKDEAVDMLPQIDVM